MSAFNGALRVFTEETNEKSEPLRMVLLQNHYGMMG